MSLDGNSLTAEFRQDSVVSRTLDQIQVGSHKNQSVNLVNSQGLAPSSRRGWRRGMRRGGAAGIDDATRLFVVGVEGGAVLPEVRRSEIGNPGSCRPGRTRSWAKAPVIPDLPLQARMLKAFKRQRSGEAPVSTMRRARWGK